MDICSQGRLEIELLPAGSVVGTMEILDAVSSGAVECGTSCDPYWAGKDPRFDIQGMIAAHFTFDEALIWFLSPDLPGRQYAEELFGKFNVHWIPIHLAPTETEYNSNKVIMYPGDYEGLTFRGTGWTGMVMNSDDFGAAGVMMPAGDVYSALERGVIDACELGNPYSNWKRGLHEVTDYVGFPGVHKLTETNGWLVNLDYWAELPDDLKMIMEMCCYPMITIRFAQENYQSALTLVDLVEYGTQICYMSSELQEEWRRVSWELAEEKSADSAEFKEMWEAMKDYTTVIRPYMTLQTPNWGTEAVFPWPVIDETNWP
jgi:TRAP-type mannitol/chloroaromatic compound transport system substrate-binding protein